MTIRVGFYGAGLIARMHTFFLGRSEVDHAIVAVHDPAADRAEAFAAEHGGRAVAEDAVLDLVDAVYDTTWTSEHPRLVEAAAAAGKAIFCEKPLAIDAPTAERMAATVAAAGVVNQVGLVLRSLGPMRLTRHLLADERAGRTMAVVFRDDQYIPIQGMYASDWRGDPARCGRGTMLEHSIHYVDLLSWWLGPVSSVSATIREMHGLDRIDDVASARFDFESGAAATLVSVWHDILERGSARHIEVFTERCVITIEHEFSGPLRYQFTGEDEVVVEGRGFEEALAAYGDTSLNPADTFLTAVRDGGPASPTFADALPAHRLVDAVYRSADRGGAPVADPDR